MLACFHIGALVAASTYLFQRCKSKLLKKIHAVLFELDTFSLIVHLFARSENE